MSTSGPNSAKPTTGAVIAGVYNATPPVLVDGQAAPLQLDVNGQIKTSGGGGGSSNVNITGVNGAAPAVTNPLPVELSDGTNPVGTAGNPLSVNVITGGGSNASVAATGAAVPASATFIGVNKGGNLVAPLADPSGNLQTVVSEALPAGTNVIGHVITDSGSTTAVTGQVDTNLKQVGGANTATAAAGVQKVGVVGGTGVILDAVLGAAKPANALQVGGNDGTNEFAIPLAAGGASVVVSGTLTPGGTQTVAGNLTNNNAAPAGTNLGVLPSLANAAAPAFTEGDLVLQSEDLSGNTRVTLGGVPAFIQAAVSSKSTGSVATLTAAYGSNVKLGTTLIVQCGVGNVTQPTITDTQGNTYTAVVNKASAAFNITIFYAISKAAGANTVTVNNGGATASIAMTVYELSGLLAPFPIDSFNSANATSTAPASGVAHPSLGLGYAFGCIGVGTAPQTVTVTTGVAPNPVWVSDSGQQNPTTPAGLQSFVAGSAFIATGRDTQFAGTISSEPWASIVAIFRPYALPVTGQIEGMIPSGSSSTAPNPVIGGMIDSNSSQMLALAAFGANLVVTQGGGTGGSLEKTTGNVTASPSTGGGTSVPGVMSCGLKSSQAAAAATIEVFRIPNAWRGAQFSAAGQNILWMPPSTKKARLMRYKIEIGEDATISGGPLPINLAFCEQLGTATGATLAYPGFGYTHRAVVPATVIATSGDLYTSDWIDIGNGQLLTTAGRALQMGIMVPQTTGAVNPTWTTSSVTWEAATIGFKTTNALGNFKLVQQTNAVASAASVAQAAIQTVTGNAVFVFWRATVAGGTPTVTVTDTAGNTYTNAAQVTTGTDFLGVAYSINAVGNAANVITVTTTTHVSSQIEAIALEYAGLGSGGVDAAQVGTTGTSTSPASGNYTPATAGDLVFSFFGTSASIASQPTIGSNFRVVGSLFNATQGTLNVADNFGNGALTAGIVNVFVAGTEE